MEPLSWKILEYKEKSRSADWYWTLGIISLAIAAAAFILGDALFGILIVLAAATFAFLALRTPKEIDVVLGRRGIQIAQSLHPYDTLESFWVSEGPDHHLHLKSGKFLLPQITIPLHDTNPADVREHLLQFLEEEEQQEIAIHRLIDRLGL